MVGMPRTSSSGEGAKDESDPSPLRYRTGTRETRDQRHQRTKREFRGRFE